VTSESARGDTSDGVTSPVVPPPLPATGAWQPGDPVGDRRFLTFAAKRPFVLEGGGQLHDVTVAYETWGQLDADGSNAVLVCHALTGDSHAAGPQTAAHPTPGWWEGLIGPGAGLDTDRYFVVCVNVLGGCQGSTGPASIDPATGAPYGSTFPVVSIRDIVRTQRRVARHLGIDRWHAVVGGSMGGMQVLEWGVMHPNRARSLVAIATAAEASPWQIGYSLIGRRAIALDPGFRGGDYYEAEAGEGPAAGLAAARIVAQITYRSDLEYEQRFGRESMDSFDTFSLDQRFEVERYLDYQGEKLARRFDANSYLVLNKVMDLHDLGRRRGGVDRALDRVHMPTLNVSISSDTLYPPHQQVRIHEALAANGVDSRHMVIESPHGHDGFLLETEALTGPVADFLDEVAKTDD
jgi:homoserine O-acetyltransferase